MKRFIGFTGGQLKRLPSRDTWRLRRLQLATSIGSMLLAATLLIVGCNSSVGVHTVPTPTPSKAATSRDVSIPTVTMQQAWGNIHPLQLPTTLPDGRVFVWENAATDDGQWLVGESEPHDFLDNTTQPEFLVLYNVTTREVRTLHQLLHPQSQIVGVSLDGDWLAWSEADDQPSFFDWTLSVYNLRTGQSHELAQAVQEGGKPVPGPAPFPAVSAGHLIWGQAVAPVSATGIDNAVVKLLDLTSGRVTTLATKAGNPELAWPWAVWGQVGAANGEGYEQVVNLETGQTHRLNVKPASLAMAGTSLVYDDVSAAYLIDDFTQGAEQTRMVAAASSAGDHIQYVTLNDRLVAWQEEDATRVYDRAERRLVTLPVTDGYSATSVAGRLLVWSQPESKGKQLYDSQHNYTPTPTLNVLDTTTLPIFK